MKLSRDRRDRAWYPLGAVLFAALWIGAIPGFAERPPADAQAGAASISGKVIAATSKKTTDILSGITVKLTATSENAVSKTTPTDFEGHYEFIHLAPGTYTLEAVAEGFQLWTATVTLAAGQVLAQDITLQISSVQERIEVQGEATEIATESVSAAATVTQQQLEDLPLRTEQFTEALSMSPSVIRTQEGKLNFNGQAESQGMLLVDSAENVDPVSGSFAIPIPVNAIENMQVFSTPDSVAYGGFSGGLTRIDIKPPGPAWNYKLLDIVPSFRGKNDHLIGLLNITPGVEFGGPLIKDKLTFTENMRYELRKDPVHGLTWPRNETITYSLVSLTQFQYTFSSKHLLNVDINVFPSTVLYADIDALIPQTASANFRRRGSSLGISDAYQFDSGMMLTTVVRYTNFYTLDRGQGSQEMTINPEGWGGNYFNTSLLNANQVEALPILQLPTISWHGNHQVQFGTDLMYRTFAGYSHSSPVNLLEQSCSPAELFANACAPAEQISFQGGGALHGTDTEVSEYAEDRWSLTKSLAVTFGGRLTQQAIGRDVAFAPRTGLAYSFPDGKMVIRAGAGLIYGHVPLLATDFTGYQDRMITQYFGNTPLPSVTLQNVYQSSGATGYSSSLMDQSSTRTLTWNIEGEAPIESQIGLRFGYYETHTTNLFVLNPIVPTSGTSGFMALENSGKSNYRQAQITVRYRPSERNVVNVSYAWSQARGDLNTIADTFIPTQSPTIPRNAYGILPSDVPNRVLAWGDLALPKKFVFSPVADLHTGFPYSNIDVLQNYVGVPDSLRFPIYFSLDVKLSRDFMIRMPFKDNAKPKKVNIGVFSLDVTNRFNPHDVYNNVTAPPPLFGQFAGFQRRLTGLIINLSE